MLYFRDALKIFSYFFMPDNLIFYNFLKIIKVIYFKLYVK